MTPNLPEAVQRIISSTTRFAMEQFNLTSTSVHVAKVEGGTAPFIVAEDTFMFGIKNADHTIVECRKHALDRNSRTGTTATENWCMVTYHGYSICVSTPKGNTKVATAIAQAIGSLIGAV